MAIIQASELRCRWCAWTCPAWSHTPRHVPIDGHAQLRAHVSRAHKAELVQIQRWLDDTCLPGQPVGQEIGRS